MKKLLYLFCLITLTCNLFSCDFERNVQDAEIVEDAQVEQEENKQSVNDNKDSIEDEAKAQEQDRIAKEEKIVSDLQTNFLAYKDSVNRIQNELNVLKTNSEKSSGHGLIYIFMVIELFLLLGCICLLWSKLEGVGKKLNQWRNSAQSNPQKSTNNHPQPWQSQTNEREIRELKTAFNSLKSRVEALEKKLSDNKGHHALKDILANQESQADSHVPSKASEVPVTNNEPAQPAQPASSKVFYMPRTSEQNRFEDDAKKYAPDDSTYFKFTMISANKAEFEFDCDDSLRVKRSFDSRKESIMTVCEIMPGSSTNPKECHTVKKGEAELHDNVWIVKRKAQILYR